MNSHQKLMPKRVKDNVVFSICLILMFGAGVTTPPLALIFMTAAFFATLFYAPLDRI